MLEIPSARCSLELAETAIIRPEITKNNALYPPWIREMENRTFQAEIIKSEKRFPTKITVENANDLFKSFSDMAKIVQNEKPKSETIR